MMNYTQNDVYIKHNGRTIYGVSYVPDFEGEIPFVIFSHGFNGTNADFATYGKYLAKKGIGAFSYDFCGGSVNSKSDLKTTEMTIFTEKEDLCAVIDTIRNWEHVDCDNIYLFGGSQGGLVTALAAEEYEEKVNGIFLLYPAFCIPDNWNTRFPTLESIPDTCELWGVTLGRKFFESIHKYNVYEHIGKFGKHVFIFHGDKDEIVPHAYGMRGADLYPNVSIEVFEGEGHGFSEAASKKVIEMTYEFIKKNL